MRQTIDEPGALVGERYRLVELAGEGGMAEVWRAELVGAMGFRRAVALKRILPHLADSETYRAMFVREASLSATLDHPNIVQVFDLGSDDAGLYMVMEWVDGLTLKDLGTLCDVYGVRPSPALVAAIIIEVLRGLGAAHDHSVVAMDGVRVASPVIHRDVSPSNVLLSVRGVVKLGDFGLARALDEAGLTPDGIVKGKLAYMAPEVIHGKPVTPRADLYGVGVVLWETLTGQRLFNNMTEGEIVMALVNGQRPPPVRRINPDVPETLAAVVYRALAGAPHERYENATAFARALGDVLRTIPERTDSSRLAREFASAIEAQRRMHAKRSPPTPRPVAYAASATPTAPDATARDGSSELELDLEGDLAEMGLDQQGAAIAIPLVKRPSANAPPGRRR